MFAFEAMRKSRRVERRYSDVRYFADHADAGHFAALGQPEAMLDDIRRLLPRCAEGG